jgi:hypothetical protein
VSTPSALDPQPQDAAATPQLAGGWGALLDGWDEQLEYRQELAWEAEERARKARQAARVWLRLLTAVSKLPAPDRDALRGYLTMGLSVEVHAALLRMSEDDFCAVLLGAALQLLDGLVGPGDAGDVGELTSLGDRLESRVAAEPSRREVA